MTKYHNQEKVLKRHQNSDDPCIMAWDHYTFQHKNSEWDQHRPNERLHWILAWKAIETGCRQKATGSCQNSSSRGGHPWNHSHRRHPLNDNHKQIAKGFICALTISLLIPSFFVYQPRVKSWRWVTLLLVLWQKKLYFHKLFNFRHIKVFFLFRISLYSKNKTCEELC